MARELPLAKRDVYSYSVQMPIKKTINNIEMLNSGITEATQIRKNSFFLLFLLY